MPDILTPPQRSRVMARIRSRDTKPEQLIRQALHREGFRYVLNDRRLPGRPDLVFPRHRAVILVHGCFWHGHDCHLYRLPGTRPEFWREKIGRNRANDARVRQALSDLGWRHLTIWECAMRGKDRIPLPDLVGQASVWLKGGAPECEIRGEC